MVEELFSGKDKVAIVKGGSSGIGKELAETLSHKDGRLRTPEIGQNQRVDQTVFPDIK